LDSKPVKRNASMKTENTLPSVKAKSVPHNNKKKHAYKRHTRTDVKNTGF